MAVPDPTTTNLGLPLKVTGHVALQKTVKRGFELIDAAIAALQGGSGLDAHEVAYTADDSNSTQAVSTVGAELDALRSRLNLLETELNDSNSTFGTE